MLCVIILYRGQIIEFLNHFLTKLTLFFPNKYIRGGLLSRLTIVPAADEYFRLEIEKISQNQGLSLEPEVKTYLGTLLVKFLNTPHLSLKLPGEEALVEEKERTPTQFWLEIQSLPLKQQYYALQILGDYSLFTSGFFNERIKKSLLDMDYYQALGGQAYYRAGEIQENISAEKALNIFFSLADSFKKVTDIFAELYDKTLVTHNDGLLKLFERWENSSSPHLERLLIQNGIILNSNKKTGTQA